MAGVYISFPFCSQKCTYCNFASGVYSAALEAEYAGALAAELARHRWEWRPETVYLGGGTPSQMAIADFERVMDAIPGRPWREATIEAAPGSITLERARAWARHGIDRASLGVQSFVPREAARTGRRHGPEQVAADLETLAGAGIRRINIDLIAGLPGQTPESWRESLGWIERLSPEHVSVYLFEIDEDSRLGREVLLGGVRYGASDVPGEAETVALYQAAIERLAAVGLARYEISNFARPGSESLHNLKYWRREAYVGFGADAHSFDGVARRRNVESLEEYLARWRRGRGFSETPEPADETEERFFVGLRLAAGIEPRASEWERFRDPIARFVGEGLLATDGRRLWLTDRGVLLSNEVFQEFVHA